MSPFPYKIVAICSVVGAGCLAIPFSGIIKSSSGGGRWIKADLDSLDLEESFKSKLQGEGMNFSEYSSCTAWDKEWELKRLTLLLKCDNYYRLYYDRQLENRGSEIAKIEEWIVKQDPTAREKLFNPDFFRLNIL